MNTGNFQVTTDSGQQQQQPKPVEVHSTTIQHPKLPSTVTVIERIALPATFAIVNGLIRDEGKRDELREYLTPLRDALNEAYPEE